MDGPARLSDSLGPLISAFVGLWTCEDEWASCGRRGHQSAMKAFMAGPLQSPPQTWTGWPAGMAQRCFTAGREQGSTQVQEGLIQ